MTVIGSFITEIVSKIIFLIEFWDEKLKEKEQKVNKINIKDNQSQTLKKGLSISNDINNIKCINNDLSKMKFEIKKQTEDTKKVKGDSLISYLISYIKEFTFLLFKCKNNERISSILKMEEKIKNIISVENIINYQSYSSFLFEKEGKLVREEYKDYFIKNILNE